MDAEQQAEVLKWLRAWKEGDPAAAESLYHNFEPVMRAWLRGFFRQGLGEPALTESDVMQTAVVAFLQAVKDPAFDTRDGNVQAFLYDIVRKKYLAKTRRPRPKTGDPARIEGQPGRPIDPTIDLIARAFEDREAGAIAGSLEAEIRKVLDGRPEAERVVIRKYYYRKDVPSWRDISRETGLPVAEIKLIIQDFERDVLKALLEDDDRWADPEGPGDGA
jgi:DNA-directed RNA polymerase specialized sigma24 family protein